MRFLKKFEGYGYSSELFWEISPEEKREKFTELLELDKYLIKIIDIVDSLKVDHRIRFYAIEGNHMRQLRYSNHSLLTLKEILKEKENREKLKNLRVDISIGYAIDICSIDDGYFIVSLTNEYTFRLNRYYKADDLDGLEECLKYLIKTI